jgi:hypothetical protein
MKGFDCRFIEPSAKKSHIPVVNFTGFTRFVTDEFIVLDEQRVKLPLNQPA